MALVDGSSLQEATREMLVRERSTAVARMRAITQDALNLEFESDGVPPSGNGREEALTTVLYTRLSNIDSALERLDAGTYGVCATCSSDIPPRRLEVQPFAILCIRCQGEADKKVSRRGVYR